MTASQQLDTYRSGFSDARDRLHALADPLTEEAFNWKPGPKAWSIGECVVHLNKIGYGYAPVLLEAVAAAPRGEGPFRYGWVSRRFVEAVRPGSRRIPTGGPMKPPPTTGTQSAIEPERALSGLDDVTARFLAVLDVAPGRDLSAVKVRSPFLPVLRLPLGAFLEALSLHAVRHTEQAERVAAAPGFPG